MAKIERARVVVTSPRRNFGEQVIVDDPIASTTRRLIESASGPSEQATLLLSMPSVFPERLSADHSFHHLVVNQLESLQRNGALATLDRLTQGRAASLQSGIGG